MKDAQNIAEGTNSSHQNIKLLNFSSGTFLLRYIRIQTDQKHAKWSEIQQIFIHKNIYHNLHVKLPYLMNHAKHGQKTKITFEIFFKVFTFHKSPLGTKSVQKLHDDAVQGLVRN
jgi:hypothetical protein